MQSVGKPNIRWIYQPHLYDNTYKARLSAGRNHRNCSEWWQYLWS